MDSERDMRRRRFLKLTAGLTGLTTVDAGRMLPRLAPVRTPHGQKGSGTNPAHPAGDIVLENRRIRFAIGSDGRPVSLLHKPTGEECLQQDTITPLCTISFLRRQGLEARFTEARGDHLPRCEKNAAHTLFSSNVERDGNRLLVGFEGLTDRLVLRLKITDSYIGFTVEKLIAGEEFTAGTAPTFQGLTFLQFPLKNRAHFGDWLNVAWDDRVAVNLLAADPRTHITSERRTGFRVLAASGQADVALEDISAALIGSRTPDLLDCIQHVEEDYHLPPGVQSRRNSAYAYSYYLARNVGPGNVDEHIEFAKQGGFRALMISYRSFTKGAGHWSWNERYPNGLKDLRKVLNRIKSAGIIPGLHAHYNKAEKSDPYVSGGTPHPGLHLRRLFTLSESMSPEDTTITVEENPRGVTLDDKRRILRVGNELIGYEGYSTTRPYRFKGCKRGHLKTTPRAHERGLKIGVLNVDSWNIFVRFDQRTSLQDEVAERIASIYNRAGFEFIYYDGAEDVHPPDWYHTSAAQLKVHERLDKPPLTGEGASFSHFSWHILSRGNPWDTQRYAPEDLKEGIREDSVAQGPRMRENFSAFTFVRLGYDPPGSKTMGIQPDMIEYACSRGAAWDCPISMWGGLHNFQTHPRTPDNLEVVRRWENARENNWLTDEHRRQLRSAEQEHILLLDENGRFDLQPYEQIKTSGKVLRAFLLTRNGTFWVVYWHTSGKGRLKLPLRGQNVRLHKEIGKPPLPIKQNGSGVVLPISGRRYLECKGLERGGIIRAFQQAEIVSSQPARSQ